MPRPGDHDYVPPVCTQAGKLTWPQVMRLWEESPIFRQHVPVEVRERMPEPYNAQVMGGCPPACVCAACYNGLGYDFVATEQANGDFAVDVKRCTTCLGTGRLSQSDALTQGQQRSRAQEVGRRMSQRARDRDRTGLPDAVSTANPGSCGKCDGFGKVSVETQSQGGVPVATWVECDACGGNGRFDPANRFCIPKGSGKGIPGQDITKPMNVW